MAKRRGVSYEKRVEEINRIYDQYAKRGVPNREIWRRYVYPVYAVTERTFYNILNASADASKKIADEETRQLLLFNDDDYEQGRAEDNRAEPEVKLHIVTDWAGAANEGSPFKEEALEVFDLPELIHERLSCMDGDTFMAFDLVESQTNHNHEEIVENIEVYSCVAFKRLR